MSQIAGGGGLVDSVEYIVVVATVSGSFEECMTVAEGRDVDWEKLDSLAG